jgi:hypothetical protein
VRIMNEAALRQDKESATNRLRAALTCSGISKASGNQLHRG